MGEDYRHWRRAGSARMQQMNCGAVDLAAQMLPPVHCRFLRAPVITVAPIVCELAQHLARHTVSPRRGAGLVSPVDAGQSLP